MFFSSQGSLRRALIPALPTTYRIYSFQNCISMKNRFLLLLLALCFSASLLAQSTPQGFNYQSIVRDNNGNALMNQTVTLLFVIRSGAANGPAAYSEKQVTSTNQYGLVNLVIGQGGIPLQGDFPSINWSGSAKFLTVSVETSTGVFDELGSSQLMSVPYALYAQNSGSGGGGGSDNWGSQTVQTNTTLSGNGTGGSPLAIAQQGAQNGQVLKWDGNQWSPAADISSTGGNGGTVTQINTGTGLTGGPISTNGTISLTNSGVTAGIYGGATQIPVISVDAQGRITSVFTSTVQPGTIGMTGGPGISVQQNGFNFTVTNTGDTNGNDDVLVTTPYGGDVTGSYNDLQIKPNAVNSPEIADNAVGNSELADNAVGSAEISANAVTTTKISNGAVTAAKLDNMGATNGQVIKWNGSTWAPAADQSGTLNLTSGNGITISGTAPNLTITNSGDTNPSDDITTSSPANGDVTGTFSNLQLKADVVGTSELSNNAVETANIANSAITGAKIDDMGATNGQVLKWNGSTWTPAADQGGTFNVLPGTGIDVTTSGSTFIVINSGDVDATDDLLKTDQAGTAGGDITGTFDALIVKTGAITSPKLATNAVTTNAVNNGAITAVKLNSMGATLNQILKWNGTVWAPANESGGGAGDNWGSQTAATGPTLTGNGTSGSPLDLAKQGATNGQILKWSNSANSWVPANDGGDNWGTQTTAVGNALTGNGTTGSPINLGKQGANTGQVLKWDGAAWTPADDLVGIIGGGNNYAAGTGISITGTAPNLTINNIGDADADPSNELQSISLSGNQLTLSDGGGTVTLPGGAGNNYTAGTAISITGTAPNLVINNTGDVSPTNELQTISLSGNNLTLSNGGGTVALPAANTYTAGAGILISGTAPNFSIKNSGDLDNTNELQTLSLTGTQLAISSTNSVDFASLLSTFADEHWKLVNNDLFNKNSGNVVIGTATPSTGKLQVVSTSGSAARLVMSDPGSANPALYSESLGAGPGGYFTSAAGPALITDIGYVGINKSNPVFQLDVSGQGHFSTNQAAPQLTVEQDGGDFSRLSLKNSGAGVWNLSGKGGAGTGAEFGLDFTGAVAGSQRILTAKGNGSVGIGGINNGPSKLKIFHNTSGMVLENVTNNHNWEFWVSSGDGSLVLYNDQLPAGVPAGTFATNGLYVPSDRNLKKEVQDMANGVLHKVLQLQPVTYRYKTEKETAQRSMGFIAQDVQSLFPELVTRNPVRDGQGGYLAVNYAGFGVLAVKSIQEQQTQIDALQKENAELRSKTESLEARLLRLEQLVDQKKN